MLAAWRAVRAGAGEELVVAGASPSELRAAGPTSRPSGVRVAGMLAYEEYRALLRRARVFVCAPRREDYGIAQLEALADGCLLVTTPAPGPLRGAADRARARRAARRRGPGRGAAQRRWTIRGAGYAARARGELAPFSRAAVDARVVAELLPRCR